MNKRKGENLGKYDKNEGAKKLKVAAAASADIPSSNFFSDKGKKISKASITTTSAITSIPNLPQKPKQDPNKLIHSINLPSKYKEVLGPNILELEQFHKEKLKREQQFKKLVAQGILPKPEPIQKEEEKDTKPPVNIILDEAGVTKDEKGNIVNLKSRKVPDLKVNRDRAKEERVKDLLKHQKSVSLTSMKSERFFDQNVPVTSIQKREKRKMHALQFFEKGSYQKKAEALRKRISFNNADMMQENSKDDENSLGQNMMPIGLKRVSVKIKHHDPIPDIEWWDLALIPGSKKTYLPNEESIPVEAKSQGMNNKLEYGNVEQHKKNIEVLESFTFDEKSYRSEKISNMIEHPVIFKNNQTGLNIVIPMFLTKDERKKIRRRKKIEREKEKQDKIKLGLIKPPPPKVKLSNLMRVLGTEAVADPSKVEKEVKKSVAERLKNHLERNAERKLTKEQKAEKMMKKLKKDSATECRVAVFRIEDLGNRIHKYKIDKNAQQLLLHGVCVVSDRKAGLNLPSLVVVEGGPKAVKFYKKLMLRRIKWDQDLRMQKAARETGEVPANKSYSNKCYLLWEGIVKDHNFKKWNVVDIRSEMEGRRALADRNVEHYWDMMLNHVPEST